MYETKKQSKLRQQKTSAHQSKRRRSQNQLYQTTNKQKKSLNYVQDLSKQEESKEKRDQEKLNKTNKRKKKKILQKNNEENLVFLVFLSKKHLLESISFLWGLAIGTISIIILSLIFWWHGGISGPMSVILGRIVIL